ncbi:PD-(D/E)XK nuclease family protein [Candidatus Persebacteraceae bacterium Df01]|jgi:probable DNA repair protein|uniref:PD-(D/E)XK nuclease family protein n=1 Tax=Candidatus Doriopsillibacter californiensis TaxID=2970740 RepID=A0ABT7QKQ1_9GAMM|nr:PD-(D/E)XK nuclease family protein [Candidatus Persebacteraceae bacterium Df01]
MTDFYSLKTLAPTFADVLSSNSQQWLFLTTRERLRQAINHEWVQLHDNQPEVIPQLRVMTLDGWVRELWKRRRRQHGGPAVLSNFAQRLLWRQIIEQWNREHRQVLSAAVLAELARAAYRYCLLFEVSVEDIQFGESEDTQAFQQWARQFQKATAAANGITLEMAALQLITELTKTPTQSQQLEVATQLRLVEENIHPLHKRLLACFSTVTYSTPDFYEDTPAFHTVAQDRQAECMAAMRWAEQHLRKQSTARIALVVADVAAYENDLRRAFIRVLAPAQLRLDGNEKSSLRFGMSLPLTQEPRIKTALDLLHWNARRIESETLYRVLEDGCWGPDDGVAQALLQRQLRALRLPSLTPERLLSASQYCAQKYPDNIQIQQLHQALADFMELRRAASSQNTLNGWAEQFSVQLRVLSWQGGSASEAWAAVFRDFVHDSRKFPRCTAVRALAIFVDQTARVLQPTKSGIINVLGPQEAAGEPFDAIWMLDATDASWPPAPAPHPLLPVRLQVTHHMPHCNAVQELKVALQTLKELRGGARVFVASAPQIDGDKECALWAPVSTLPPLPPLPDEPDRWTQWIQNAHTPLEVWQPGNAPQVGEKEKPRGGVGILQAQLNCPFSAFARYRLQAMPLETAVLGLDSADWGNYLHVALKQFWEEKIKSWEQLQSIDDDEREKLLKTILHKCFDTVLGERVGDLGGKLRDMEERRALVMLMKWLKIEDTRQPFTIEQVEKAQEVNFCGLNIKIRLDRVDALDNGQLVVIDYKTGTPKSTQVWEEPLREPQLPLYALLDEQIVTIAFAQVHHSRVRYITVGALLTKDGKADKSLWADRKQYWQKTLEQLANDFMAGVAVPTGNDEVYLHNGLRLLARHQFYQQEIDNA